MLALFASLVLAAPALLLTEIPEIKGREFAAHKAVVTHLAGNDKGTELFTTEAAIPVEPGSNQAYCALRAWEVKNGLPLWEASLFCPGVVSFDVGGEHIVHNYGILMFGRNEVATGNDSGGLGGPNPGTRVTSIVADPKDRWVWLGTAMGGVVRLNPEDVNGWSRRGVDGGGVTSLAMDSAGKKLAIGGADGAVRFVNPVGCKVDKKRNFQLFEDPVATLCYDRKGKRLAVGSTTGAIKLVSETRGTGGIKFAGHEAAICAFAFDPKNKQLASGDVTGRVMLWNLKSGKPLATLQSEATGRVAGLVFVDKGKTLVGTSGGSSLVAWDLSKL